MNLERTFNLGDRDLAEQLHKLKKENAKKQIEIERIKESDPTIQDLKKKIEISYMNKERSRQLSDKQVHTLQ